MNATPDHSGNPTSNETAADPWSSLWEPAARRYQPIIEQPLPGASTAPSPSPDVTLQP
ncbi:hypothetical protein LFT48_08960 [Arthrobacter sp. FW305-123]|uniref:hypothetical protein n=1 Tax=Paenarthrobacter aurescens TaxID=43663 RepID=UPI0035EBD2DA|nr:hypothetical protein LFT48_08960 [Arthrobacter sp. FW305-123]